MPEPSGLGVKDGVSWVRTKFEALSTREPEAVPAENPPYLAPDDIPEELQEDDLAENE